MRCDVNPYRELCADISPSEFEIFCMNTLSAYAERERLKDFKILHNQKIATDDGIYQIDLLCEFVALGSKITVVVECKCYANPVEREKVAVLNDKLHSLGAQKGILISTSGFQSGAAQYAKKHGIALIQIFDSYVKYITNSIQRPTPDMEVFMMEVRKRLPSYSSFLWDCELDFPFEEIYPTPKMKEKIMEEVRSKYIVSKQ